MKGLSKEQGFGWKVCGQMPMRESESKRNFRPSYRLQSFIIKQTQSDGDLDHDRSQMMGHTEPTTSNEEVEPASDVHEISTSL